MRAVCERLVVAIDGPAASGKGTLARRLADALGLPYLDTGTLYRAVARRCLDDGVESEDGAAAIARALSPDETARDDLRTPAVDRMASRVAAWPAVRTALLETQRRFGRETGAVVDGRDIGTVVFPDAGAKLFVTASGPERARRRLLQRGEAASGGDVAREAAILAARDEADRTREAAPLLQAADAVLLDTTSLGPEETFREALRIVKARRPGEEGKGSALDPSGPSAPNPTT